MFFNHTRLLRLFDVERYSTPVTKLGSVRKISHFGTLQCRTRMQDWKRRFPVCRIFPFFIQRVFRHT